MRICLYVNETAGQGPSVDELTRAIERAGHTVARVAEDERALRQAVRERVDCLVAAGGDGTVALAGRVLARGNLPLAILPLGTANNIAASVGAERDVEEAIASWRQQRIVRIDAGVIEDAHGHCLFFEGVGVGLLPKGIEIGSRVLAAQGDQEPAQSLDVAREVFLDALRTLEPRHYGLTIDGEVFEQESLLIEVLNISTVGPRIRLSPEANPADGFLSVIVAGAGDRELIARHLRGRWDDDADHARLKSWRATRIEMRGWHDYHVDDEVRVAEGETVTVHVEPGVLPVLA